MNLNENRLLGEFNQILKLYEASPFGFRLRRTGRSLRLLEYNGLHYLNIQNLFNIVDELLGPNIPTDMIPFLEKIIFSEEITIETKNGLESRQVTCVQFIDTRFFDRCVEWLQQNPGYFDASSKENLTNSLYDSMNGFKHFTADDAACFDGILPFQSFSYDEKEGCKKSKAERYLTDPRVMGQAYGILPRPRGKNMENIGRNSEDRPFACEIPFCNRSFKRHEHLKRHLKMHSGERPFKCDHAGCTKSFSRSDNLTQHYKTHSMAIKKKGVFGSMMKRKFGTEH